MSVPLEGLTIIVTRPAAQAARFLELAARAGARCIAFPTIEIQRMSLADSTLDEIAHTRWDWAIYTSTNAVDAAHEALGGQLPAARRMAAVGRATARALSPHYAIIQDSLVLLHDLEKRIGLYLVDTDRGFARDLSARYPREAARMERSLLGFLQTATHAMRADRIYRDGGTTSK